MAWHALFLQIVFDDINEAIADWGARVSLVLLIAERWSRNSGVRHENGSVPTALVIATVWHSHPVMCGSWRELRPQSCRITATQVPD